MANDAKRNHAEQAEKATNYHGYEIAARRAVKFQRGDECACEPGQRKYKYKGYNKKYWTRKGECQQKQGQDKTEHCAAHRKVLTNGFFRIGVFFFHNSLNVLARFIQEDLHTG